MWQLIVKNKYLFILYVLLLTLVTAFIVIEGKVNSHLAVTNFHTEFLDWFFRLFTLFGDGLFMVLTGLIFLLLVRIRYGFVIFTSFFVTSLMVQVLKKIIFPDHIRPILFFRNMGLEIYQVPGLDYHSFFSFPSGHSATAFALFIGFALFSGNTILKLASLLMACIIAYSRVYLSQHFLEDILFGSIIGTTVAFFVYYFFTKLNRSWTEKSLLKLI